MATNLVNDLQKQLTMARNEVKNLRKQINALTHIHQTDLKTITNVLTDFKCMNCKEQNQIQSSATKSTYNDPTKETIPNGITFKPIGIIRTEFPQKRAVPRQPSVCANLVGCIELGKDVFNNPEHALERLGDFSHLWIIYHFHKNDSHAKAKIAPPRLHGDRVGIFSTRSPHRPCPIGLSLVEIDRIDGHKIYFHGTDMVDGTPVLDIKPYIPRYDNPLKNRLTDGQSTSVEDEDESIDTREEPDGEETINKNSSSQRSTSFIPAGNTASGSNGATVKVPNWILSDTSLEVVFNDRATAQIDEFQINRANIVEILRNDPRSVYLKTRYGSQIFTFQLGEVTVTCKFDDSNGIVTVVQIRKSENLSTQSTTNNLNIN